jgi:hypothetical protein
MGESGSGKTTSCRNLPPEQTFYFDCDQKGLSWKGWRKNFNSENKNYLATSDGSEIASFLEVIDTKPNIKYVVIDTLNGIMVDDEMRRMGEKGYDKWQDMAVSIYSIVARALTMRSDLTVIFLAHSQTDRDDFGNAFTRMKTSGRKLDKIVVESKFTNVLLAKRTAAGEYVFETHANNSTAKTPMGAFNTETVPNDIMAVIAALEDFR